MLSIVLQVVINGLLLGGIYALVAIGLTLIFGVVRVINFAQGEFLMIGMYAAFWLFHLVGIDPYLSLWFITVAVFALGMLTQKVIIRPLQNAPSSALIFATFGLSIVLQNSALMLWKSDHRAIQTAYSNAVFLLGDLVINVPRLVVLLVTIAIVIALFLFLQRTYFGKAMTAVAQDREAAMLMGVDIHKVYRVAFGVGVGLEALAGALLIPIYSAVPTIGFHFCIIAFVVVVLGGMGNMFGAFIAGLIIGLVEAFSGFFISPQLQAALYYVIFVVVLVIRPQGLLGMVGAQEMGLK
jgi:branched-chain amino acid transport system permease protein